MNPKTPRNLSASVHQRLLNLSRERGDDPNYLFIRYGAERLLYRLSQSPSVGSFILKGAMLFSGWTQAYHRPTKDLDLLGSGDPSPERIEEIFRSLCNTSVEDDGLTFDPESIRIEEIREQDAYGGLRVRLNAHLGNVKIPVQVDIAFGDTVLPDAITIEYPTLLDFPRPKLLAYPPESVVAEKFHGMVFLGMANSRMKDYYDLFIIHQRFSFDVSQLREAIRATFKRRRTPLPTNVPLALSDEFAEDQTKRTQWKAFRERNALRDAPDSLSQIVTELRGFFMPIMEKMEQGLRSP